MIIKDSAGNRYFKIIIAIALISGFALTAIGLSNLTWQSSLSWADTSSLNRFVGFLIVTAVMVSLFSRVLHRNTGLAVLMAAVLFAMLGGALWPLLVTLWFAGASTILGYWILKKFKIEYEDSLICFLVGAGMYGTVVGLLAHYPVSYPGVYSVALALPLVLGWRVVLEKGENLYICIIKADKSRFNSNWLDVAIGVLALVYFVVALMPELGYDSLVTHLFVPAHLAQRHKWGFDASTYVWAVMPMLGDWIFSIGYMLASETGARLINIGFIFVLAGLIRNIVLWAGGSALGARWAILIFLSTPLTFTEGSSLYIESIWASFAVAGVLALLKACSTSGKPKLEIPVAGLLLGAALAAKAVTFTLLPALFLLLVWRYKSWYKATGLQFVMLGLCLFLAIGVIPYATAWRLTGNPVFPMFNKVFQSPYYSITENFNNQAYNSGFTWDVLYRATFDSGKYLEASAGASGFQWLLLFIPALVAIILFRKIRSLALLLIGILTIMAVFYSQSYLRYILPSWVILTGAIGVILSSELKTRKSIRFAWHVSILFTIILNLIFFNSGNGFYRDFPLKSILDKPNRDKYLQTRLPIRNAIELVNQLNVNKLSVAVFADPLAAGLSGDALYTNWYNASFNKEISSVQTEQDFVNVLRKRKVDFIILDSNCCGDAAKQAIIENASDLIVEYGLLSVRKLKTSYQFKTELLINPGFKTIAGWTISSGAKYDANTGVILAGVDAPAYQQVVVHPGVRYLNTIEARCAKTPAAGRVQINWLDLKEQFISASIKTFECSSVWSEQTMEIIAPQDAVKAMVYVSGQTATPLEFKSNSLRQ